MNGIIEIIENLFSFSYEKPWFFTEINFLLIFSLFLFGYAFFDNKSEWRRIYLILFSLFFYYKSSGPFLLLFIGVIICDFFLAKSISKSNGTKRKIILVLSIIYSTSFLLYFKYTNFFIGNLNNFFDTQFTEANLFLPIGISFYTFQSLSYLIDVYKKEILPSEKFTDYAFYMTFFPHLVAGPIVRARDFLPQINQPFSLDSILLKEGIFRICIGFTKKLLIADYLAKYVDLLHDNPTGFSGFEHLMSMYAYTFQIYFDFSGYSDIAIGIALILGYRLKENFDNPYGAFNITEFWRKWHISLSLWLRDYIYIPLGGNRNGVFNSYLFIFITMLVGGFWHGADWRFVFWGIAHGLLLISHKLISPYLPKKLLFSNVLGLLFTFHLVGILWIFFRATSFEASFMSIEKIFCAVDLNEFIGFWTARPEVLIALGISCLIIFTPKFLKGLIFDKIKSLPLIIWPFIILLIVQLVIQLKDQEVQPFIYFQF